MEKRNSGKGFSKLIYEKIKIFKPFSDLIGKYKLYSGYDKKRDCKLVDINKLNSFLIKLIQYYKNPLNKNPNRPKGRGIFIVSNILKSHMVDSNPVVASDGVFETNKKSISKTNNKQFKKINKNKNKKIKGIIIDSHLSHYLQPKHVDLCIVTKCGLKTLEKRLKKRKYSKEKTRENIDCEIFDVCLNEARERGHNPIVIDTTQGINISDISTKLKWK